MNTQIDGEWCQVEDVEVSDWSDDSEKKRYAAGARIRVAVPSGGGYTAEAYLTPAQAVDLHAALGRYLMLRALGKST